MKKNIIIIAMVALLSVLFVYAWDAIWMEGFEPADEDTWPIDGLNKSFKINCSPFYAHVITNSSLFTNLSGSWSENMTNGTWLANYTNEQQFIFTAQDTYIYETGVSATAGVLMKYGIRCTDNGTNHTWTENRTMWLKQAPTIDVLTPATGAVSDESSVNLNVSVSGNSDMYTCSMYTNESSIWESRRQVIVANNTPTLTNHIFQDDNLTKWGLKCSESSNPAVFRWSGNRTYQVDTTALTVTINSPRTGYETDHSAHPINATCTGTLLANMQFFLDGELNVTIPASSISSGVSYIVQNLTVPAGNYSILVSCNSTAGTFVNSTAHTVAFDSSAPNITGAVSNITSISSCDTISLQFTANESVASSVMAYAPYGEAKTSTDTYTTDGTTRKHNLTFNQKSDVSYEVEINVTDYAGNNGTYRYNVTTPLGLCEGWSVFTLYENTNLSDLETDVIDVDFLYFWNSTTQAWIYKTNGTSTNGESNILKGDVVYMYTTGDNTWYRSATSTEYTFDLTNGTNYFGITDLSLTYDDISDTHLVNSSGGNRTNSSADSPYNFVFTDFAAWNNTGKSWVSYHHDLSWENTTKIGRQSNNSLDATWVWSNNFKVQYNSSVNSIYKNTSSVGE